jgi:hypothetical protein
VTLGAGVERIGNYAFEFDTKLSSITIPGSVATIGEDAFTDCSSLKTAVIGNGVMNIEDGAFNETALSNVTIPNTVTNIGGDAFANPTGALFFQGNAPMVDGAAFTVGAVFGTDFRTVYDLPGTTGWGSIGVLWNPLIQAGAVSFGVQTNQFGFNISGTTNIPIVVEACTNLTAPAWFPVATLEVTNGSVYFSEPLQAGNAGRYYRISSP